MQRAAGKHRFESAICNGYGICGSKEMLGTVSESEFPSMVSGYRDHVRAYIKADQSGISRSQEPVKSKITGSSPNLQRTSGHNMIVQQVPGLKPSILLEVCLHPIKGFGILKT